MFVQRTQRTDGRIVSISQPHVRPIVRGKTGAKVEFGAKLSASLDGGYFFLDQLDWNNFNESKHLISQVETYHQRRGYYPTSVHVDKIYRIPIEGKFGQSKRRFGLDRVMTKLAITSQCVIAMTFLVINLEKGLRLLFLCLYYLLQLRNITLKNIVKRCTKENINLCVA